LSSNLRWLGWSDNVDNTWTMQSLDPGSLTLGEPHRVSVPQNVRSDLFGVRNEGVLWSFTANRSHAVRWCPQTGVRTFEGSIPMLTDGDLCGTTERDPSNVTTQVCQMSSKVKSISNDAVLFQVTWDRPCRCLVHGHSGLNEALCTTIARGSDSQPLHTKTFMQTLTFDDTIYLLLPDWTLHEARLFASRHSLRNLACAILATRAEMPSLDHLPECRAIVRGFRSWRERFIEPTDSPSCDVQAR
jgi:hypothetical protein